MRRRATELGDANQGSLAKGGNAHSEIHSELDMLQQKKPWIVRISILFF